MKPFIIIFFIFSSFCFANHKNDSFSTRLHDRLAIAAIKCQGNETTASIDQEMWADYTCADDEWLMVVDNINQCDDNISCTDIPVMPIIVKLKRVFSDTIEMTNYYQIISRIPVSAEVRWILRRYWVRFDLNGVGEVILKK